MLRMELALSLLARPSMHNRPPGAAGILPAMQATSEGSACAAGGSPPDPPVPSHLLTSPASHCPHGITASCLSLVSLTGLSLLVNLVPCCGPMFP